MKKILIIEDEEVLGELLRDHLTSEGYETYWEKDGLEGIARLKEVKPDVVLLDMVMPKMNGYETLEKIRADEETREVPVIVISNSGQPVEIRHILDMGVKDYIIKAQFSPAEVLEKVHKYISPNADQKSPTISSVLSNPVARLLIVEDDPFLSSIAAMHLKKKGCSVTVAVDGENALALLEKEIPDLILLDIIMPGISGIDVLKKIKADERYKDVSVIMFSNLGQEHEIEECTNAGAEDFLIKAMVTPQEVLDRVLAILKRKGKLQ